MFEIFMGLYMLMMVILISTIWNIESDILARKRENRRERLR
jgi:hypothetical protein